MVSQEELVNKLKRLGVRLTPQRLAIAEVVVNSGDHPTAKDIYERVRAFFPSLPYITLATVYSTLSMLEADGIVRELPFQRQSRYDANLSPHVNLVCINCGTVVDAEVGQEAVAELGELLQQQSNFEVASQRVDFYGWCTRCAADRRRAEVQPPSP